MQHIRKTCSFRVCVKRLLAGFLSAKGKRYRWSCQGEEMETGTAKLSAGLRACCAVVSLATQGRFSVLANSFVVI